MGSPYVNLLAFPCAGGSATMYLRWRRLLPQWICVVPVELPGRGVRFDERPIECFDELVTRVCEEHAPVLRNPCALWGHSMGGLLAYAVMQRLRAQGRLLPQAVFVSASRGPSTHDEQRFALRSDAELIADLRKHGGTPEDIFGSPELLRLTLDTLRSDYRGCATFRYASAPPLPVPIAVLAGRDDEIAAAEVEAWQRETSHPVSVRWFDGGHFFIREHECAVADVIVSELRKAQSGCTVLQHSIAMPPPQPSVLM